ncbi:MAG TPA: hypothetical protein VMT30_01805 [Candidatus Saccharimonadia bacterium]|nr:hypothetical protein [Candidatus Saccharimonadia bacterium]
MGEPDEILQATCQEIVTLVATAIDAESSGELRVMRLPGGAEVGRQMTIDATESGGRMNRCHLSILNADTAPAEEVVRIEYEHDKQGKFEQRRVYSVQSVRRRGGKLVLLENFIAENPETVREEDFRSITSDSYARTAVKSVQDWTRYRTWQLQQTRKR